MKRVVIVVLVILVICGYCYINKSQDTKDDNPTRIVDSSLFVGEWYCSEINSCNNMKIFLSITQKGDSLYIIRDMKSEIDSNNGSYLEGSAKIIDEKSFFAEFTDGYYSLTTDGYLVEYFEKNSRWNIYTKGFSDQPIDGRYQKYE